MMKQIIQPVKRAIKTMPLLAALLAAIRFASAQTVLPMSWQFNPAIETQGVALTSDGSLIAVGAGSAVSLYETSSQLPFRQITPHEGGPTLFRFSPDGATIAIVTAPANKPQLIELWNYLEGKYLGSLSPDATTILSISFSPNGKALAVGGVKQASASSAKTGVLEQWEVSTRSRVSKLKTKATSVETVSYSRNGRTLAEGGVSGSAGSLELWNPLTNALTRALNIGDLTGVYAVVFPPSGTTVASAGSTSTQGAIKLWNLNDGTDFTELRGNYPNGYGANLSPDATRFTTVTVNSTLNMGQPVQTSTVNLWSVDNLNQPIGTYQAGWNAAGAAFSADGSKFAFVGTIDVGYELGMEVAEIPTTGYFTLASTTGQLLTTASLTQYSYWGPYNSYLEPGFSQTGKFVVAGGTDYGTQIGTVNIWNTKDGSLATAVPTSSAITEMLTSFSADDKWLALSGTQMSPVGVQIWDLTRTRLVETLAGEIAPWRISFAPKGTLLAIAGSDTSGFTVVQIWDVATGLMVESLETSGNQGVNAFAFSKDGQTLALSTGYLPHGSKGTPQPVLEVWDLHTAKRAFELATSESAVNGVTISPDGKSLLASGTLSTISSSATGKIEIWNLATGTLKGVLPLYAGTASVSSTVFSQSGDLIYASATGGPGPIQVIDASHARLLGYLNNGGPFFAISPEATFAVSAGAYLGLSVSTIPTLVTAAIKSVSFQTSTIPEWGTATGTIRLVAPAPAGGLTVGLEVASPPAPLGYLTVPTTVTFPSGATAATFTAQGSIIESNTTYTVTAISGTHSASTTLTVAEPSIASFTLSSSKIVGGNTVTGTITINDSPPLFAAFAWLTTVGSGATVPNGVEFDNGAAVATFTITTTPVTTPQIVTITASVGTSQQTVQITINPPGA